MSSPSSDFLRLGLLALALLSGGLPAQIIPPPVSRPRVIRLDTSLPLVSVSIVGASPHEAGPHIYRQLQVDEVNRNLVIAKTRVPASQPRFRPSLGPSVPPLLAAPGPIQRQAMGNRPPAPSSPSSGSAPVLPDPPTSSDQKGAQASLSTEDITEYNSQPASVQRLLSGALALTRQRLGYKFGSCDPASGGMDCSGFVSHVLTKSGVANVPRDSFGIYQWVKDSGKFTDVGNPGDRPFSSRDLRPGDLMFWIGTYTTKGRTPPVSHVAIYLGVNRRTGQPVTVGSSDGRSFEGVKRYGVSVFDLGVKATGLTGGGSRFIGYGPPPGLR